MSVFRSPVRSLVPPRWGSLTRESVLLPFDPVAYFASEFPMRILVSSLQVWCDGSVSDRWDLGFSQCRLDHARKTCRYDCATYLHVSPLSQHASFLIAVSLPGRLGVLRGLFALNLLPF